MSDSTTPLLDTNRHRANGDSSWWTSVVTDCKYVLSSSPLNVFLIFVPLGILWGAMEWSHTWTFFLNFMAIIPLASVLAYATEALAEKAGSTIGALLNATLGNAVELIVSIIALKERQIRIVQASMMGSLLGNLLLVVGFCFTLGGINRVQQSFNQTAAQTMCALLAISCASLLIPAAFQSTLPHGKSDEMVEERILSLSRGTSIVLLIVYVLFLIFQLKTHHKFFEEQNEETNSTLEEYSTMPKHTLSLKSSLTVLLISTVLVSVCADYLVGTIDNVVSSTGLSKTFIGLSIIPIVGNAAEHVTAVFVAMKDKMDLALGVAVGSSLQVALFVTPFLVLLGWAMDIPMTLNFSTFETATLFIAILLSNYLIMDGESNWLEGVMAIAMYLLIAIAFYYYPDSVDTYVDIR